MVGIVARDSQMSVSAIKLFDFSQHRVSPKIPVSDQIFSEKEGNQMFSTVCVSSHSTVQLSNQALRFQQVSKRTKFGFSEQHTKPAVANPSRWPLSWLAAHHESSIFRSKEAQGAERQVSTRFFVCIFSKCSSLHRHSS